MRLVALLVLVSFIPMSAYAARLPASAYSDVRYIAEADDLVGMELRLHRGPNPGIDFVLCEGGCYDQVYLPITPTANGFTFVYRQKTRDEHGQPAADNVMRFTATYRGKDIIVRMKGAPEDRLKLLRHPPMLR
jgi:hypothetical protein